MGTFLPVCNDDLPLQLKQLATSNLQRYIDEPPGAGMAVIYVQIVPNRKMYVGQHCHGKLGQSFARSRMNKLADKGCVAVHDAFRAFGKESVRSFIIAHCPEGHRYDTYPVHGDSNDLEKHYISPFGLNTLVPHGLNLQAGGCGGPTHQSTIEKITAKKNSIESKANYQKTIQKPDVKARINAAFSTASFKKKRSQASKITCAKPTFKAAMKAAMKKRWSGDAKEKNFELIRAKTKAKDEAKFLPLLAACKTQTERDKVQKKWDQLERNRACQRRYDANKRDNKGKSS